jgi:hypothetical protein
MKFTQLKWKDFSHNYVTMLSDESTDTVIFHSSKQISTLKVQEVKYMEDIGKKDKGLQQESEVVQGLPGTLTPRIFLTFGTRRVLGRQN